MDVEQRKTAIRNAYRKTKIQNFEFVVGGAKVMNALGSRKRKELHKNESELREVTGIRNVEQWCTLPWNALDTQSHELVYR